MSFGKAQYILMAWGVLSGCADGTKTASSADVDSDSGHSDVVDSGSPDAPDDPPDAPPTDTGTDSGTPPETGTPPPRGSATLEWTLTDYAPAGRHHSAAFGPDEPYEVWLGSVRSGWFRSNTNPPNFSITSGGISPHAFGRVSFVPGDSDILISSGGRYMNLSIDGGESWRSVTLTDPSSGEVLRNLLTGLAVDETAVWLADDAGYIWESRDFGETFDQVAWLPLGGGSSKHGETVDELDPWMYDGPGLFYLGDDVVLLAWDGVGLYRSDDRARSWEEIMTGSMNRNAIATLGDTLYVGSEEGVWRSIDGGDSFEIVPELPEHCIDIAGSPERLALACDGGLWIYDGSVAIEVDAPEEVLSVAISELDSDVVLAGMEEGVLWSTDGGETVEQVNEALYSYNYNTIAADPEDPDHVIIGTICSRGLFRSRDRGESWDFVDTQAHYVMVATFSVADPTTIYVTNGLGGSRGQVFRSEDRGFTFTETGPLPDADATHPHGIALHPTDPMTLLVGTSEDDGLPDVPSGLFRSEDGAETWSSIGEGLPFDTSAIVAIAYDPFNPERVFVGTGPGGTYHLPVSLTGDPSLGTGDGLWLSEDAGATFTRAGGDLPRTDIWDVEINAEGVVFVATNSGIYRSVDDGSSFEQVVTLVDAELTQVATAWTDPDLVAYVHYRGSGFSDDGGTTWSELSGSMSGSLEEIDVAPGALRSLSFNADATALYLGTTVVLKAEIAWSSDTEDAR